ncbi:MAG: DUF1294 domain-containing protein [Firmicutes bacterium]|nr:DUF1294 domain-containing protein [Bacillota bacterium]
MLLLEYISRYFEIFVLIYLFWNVVTFLLMGIDKYKSIKGYYRVKEYTLIMTAFLLGGIGAFAGSLFFKHKTSKLKFRVLLPLAIIVNLVVIGSFVKYVL